MILYTLNYHCITGFQTRVTSRPCFRGTVPVSVHIAYYVWVIFLIFNVRGFASKNLVTPLILYRAHHHATYMTLTWFYPLNYKRNIPEIGCLLHLFILTRSILPLATATFILELDIMHSEVSSADMMASVVPFARIIKLVKESNSWNNTVRAPWKNISPPPLNGSDSVLKEEQFFCPMK